VDHAKYDDERNGLGLKSVGYCFQAYEPPSAAHKLLIPHSALFSTLQL